MTLSCLPLLFLLGQSNPAPAPYPAQQPYQYPQQPYQYPQQPYQEPPTARFVSPTRGFESAVHVGFADALGEYGKALDRSVRFGGIVGRRLGARFSLGLSIDFDRYSPKNRKISQYGLGVGLVPSVYLPFSNGEFILSPRIGAIAIWKSEDAAGPTFEQTATGLSFGGSVTVAFAAKYFRLGPMVSLERQSLLRVCETELGSERCHDPGEQGRSSGNVVLLSLAAWF